MIYYPLLEIAVLHLTVFKRSAPTPGFIPGTKLLTSLTEEVLKAEGAQS